MLSLVVMQRACTHDATATTICNSVILLTIYERRHALGVKLQGILPPIAKHGVVGELMVARADLHAATLDGRAKPCRASGLLPAGAGLTCGIPGVTFRTSWQPSSTSAGPSGLILTATHTLHSSSIVFLTCLVNRLTLGGV